MKLDRTDMETIINWNMQDVTMSIHTRMKSVMRHMENKLGIQPVKVYKDNSGVIYGKDYEIPKSYLRLPQKPRQLSEERKKELSERMKAYQRNTIK